MQQFSFITWVAHTRKRRSTYKEGLAYKNTIKKTASSAVHYNVIVLLVYHIQSMLSISDFLLYVWYFMQMQLTYWVEVNDSKCGKEDKQVITIPFTETMCNYKKSTLLFYVLHIFITHMLAPQSSSILLHVWYSVWYYLQLWVVLLAISKWLH